MSSSYLQNIKYVYGLTRLARKDGTIMPLKFYYQLKSLHSRREERFIKGEILESIQSLTGESRSSIQKKLSKCVKLGFIRKEGNGYYLNKYQKVWAYYGFEFTEDKNQRLQNGVLLRIKNTQDQTDLWDRIQIAELAANFSQQDYMRREKYFWMVKSNEGFDTTNCEEVKLEKKDKTFSTIMNFFDRVESNSERYQLYHHRNHLNYTNFSWEVTLSAQGFCKLFGYKDAKSAYEDYARLESKGYIDVTRRKPTFLTRPDNLLNHDHDNSKFQKSCAIVWKSHSVLKYRCNLIEINKECDEFLYV